MLNIRREHEEHTALHLTAYLILDFTSPPTTATITTAYQSHLVTAAGRVEFENLLCPDIMTLTGNSLRNFAAGLGRDV